MHRWILTSGEVRTYMCEGVKSDTCEGPFVLLLDVRWCKYLEELTEQLSGVLVAGRGCLVAKALATLWINGATGNHQLGGPMQTRSVWGWGSQRASQNP